jgi:hypothetical protein
MSARRTSAVPTQSDRDCGWRLLRKRSQAWDGEGIQLTFGSDFVSEWNTCLEDIIHKQFLLEMKLAQKNRERAMLIERQLNLRALVWSNGRNWSTARPSHWTMLGLSREAYEGHPPREKPRAASDFSQVLGQVQDEVRLIPSRLSSLDREIAEIQNLMRESEAGILDAIPKTRQDAFLKLHYLARLLASEYEGHGIADMIQDCVVAINDM